MSNWLTCSCSNQDLLAREHWHRRQGELMRLVTMLATWKAEGQGARDVLLTTGTGGGISCGRSEDCHDACKLSGLCLVSEVLACIALVFDVSGLETLVTCHLADPSPGAGARQPHAMSVTLRQLTSGPIHDRPGCDISLSKEGHMLNVQHEHLRVRHRSGLVRRAWRLANLTRCSTWFWWALSVCVIGPFAYYQILLMAPCL